MKYTKTYIITTQNVEEYGTNFHKFKGGSTYHVHFNVTQQQYDDEYTYEVPSLTEASAAALVMQHVNRYNGLRGSFDYITNIEVGALPHGEKDFDGWEADLVAGIKAVKEAA